MEAKHIVITGASSGIGAALAKRLAGEGHRLVLAARRERELRAVADACGGRATAVPTDVTRREEVNRLRDAALAALGHVDAWVNNAGQGITRGVLDLTDDDVDAMMVVNVKSALYGMQAIVPHFQARGRGHLVNVSSFLSKIPLATFRSAYSAAKSALGSLTTSLRLELLRTHPGVQVSLVLPGMVATEFAANARGGRPAAPPPGGMTAQTAEEVAAAIAGLLENPAPVLYTNPAHAALAAEYERDVAAFEARLAVKR
jgi:short-subunit dehydrogenase